MAELGKLHREPDGLYRHREWRGVADTAYDFGRWLVLWKDLVVFVGRAPVPIVRALFRYRWFSSYISAGSFVDHALEGKRGAQLRMSGELFGRVVKKVTDMLYITFSADQNVAPGNKKSGRVVLYDELIPCELFAGFPNVIPIAAQTLPVFFNSIMDQKITPPYLDVVESFGVPADVCPLPAAEAGCALADDYPKMGCCFIACTMPCDGSVMTTTYQDRYFKLPTYYLGVPLRYDEDAVQTYAVEELRGCIRFIEEHTGETFDWPRFFAAMKNRNRQLEYELEKWEVNRSDYPQITAESLWLYRMLSYQQTGGMDPGFLKTDKKVSRIMLRAYEAKAPCSSVMRHRAVEWSCPANYYPHFSVWLENCWGVNIVTAMEVQVSDVFVNEHDPDQALRDLARSYQRTTMRKHTKGGYDHVLTELWRVCAEYRCDLVVMHDQISCKGMNGLKGIFEDQARERGVRMMWISQDLMDARTISRREMRHQANLYMQTVLGEEPLDASLLDFDDSQSW